MQTLTTNRIPTREEREAYGQAARAIYESLRERLEKDHWGEYMVIHPGNGDYIVSADEEEALEQMRAKYPCVVFQHSHRLPCGLSFRRKRAFRWTAFIGRQL
jgi:hypothetical protein